MTRKQMDKAVEQAYYKACSGIQIGMLDIGRVFAVGREAVDRGEAGEQLQATIRAFVETIRKN